MDQLPSLDQAAWILLEELRAGRLEVAKIKGLRKSLSSNAEWYQRFCANNVRSLKRYPRLRTVIKRWWTIKVLEKLVDGKANLDTIYVQRLLPFLEERL